GPGIRMGLSVAKTRLNPSIQIRAVRTRTAPPASRCATTPRLNPSIQIRAVRTVPEGVKEVCRTIQREVSIPQYQIREFGQYPSQTFEEQGVKEAVFPASPKAPPFDGRASAFHR